MIDVQKEHLREVTEEAFKDWMIYSNHFIVFASNSFGENYLELGLNIDGDPSIKKDGRVHPMSSVEAAVAEYKRLTKKSCEAAPEFIFLSPDGFPINEPFSTEEEGWEFFEEWKTRYETQGYYSSNNGRIPLYDLENHIKIQEV